MLGRAFPAFDFFNEFLMEFVLCCIRSGVLQFSKESIMGCFVTLNVLNK